MSEPVGTYAIDCPSCHKTGKCPECSGTGYVSLKPRESEATVLRRRFAKYLAPHYAAHPVEVAKLCDEELDRTGALLGFVREEAALQREQT